MAVIYSPQIFAFRDFNEGAFSELLAPRQHNEGNEETNMHSWGGVRVPCCNEEKGKRPRGWYHWHVTSLCLFSFFFA